MSAADWFRTADGADGGAARVYCFPHAGGNAQDYLRWQDALGTAATVVAVTMPGRAHRYAEPAPATIEAYADGAAAAIGADADVPFVLFGHSLGALTAFEVARRLRGHPRLRRLVASGAAAPRLMPSPRVVRTAALEGREFVRAVAAFGGLPPEVVAVEELHDFLLPPVQADFRLVAGYRYRPAEPLPVPITVINGAGDDHVTADRLAAWSAETVHPVRRCWADGGHFYLRSDPEPVLAVLRGATGPAPSHAGHSDLLI
ncbi:thioesterase II family protein [Plantactinospora sp. KBS50]|uniref:thioesterase II family protein n=1 Tax=Plantactinospora sp. KBS50 TaxID=2024580 RepID=UPI000BAB1CFC|nr:alpha/beta fold hydrolase [Plantactinospora sp. KBS50]ASW55626.1 hypothetical protein CIK06_17730 [Plantactinospora sp. KBS50]